MALANNLGQTITARDADPIVMQFKKEQGDRVLNPLPDFVENLLSKQTVHVFNVGPWQQLRHMGGYGLFAIPACPTGQPYVEMKPCLTDPMLDTYVKNEAEMDRFFESGRKFANELLGLGRGQNSSFSLVHKGCFVAVGDEPTEAELAAARVELELECKRLVNEAREWHASGDPNLKRAITPEIHFTAAETIGLNDEPWMIARTPQARQKCGFCGTYVDADVVRCPTVGCGYVFDAVRYAEAIDRQEKQVEAARRKGKKE